MIYSQSIREVKGGRFRLAMSRAGLIAYDRETPITIRFNEKETLDLLKKNIEFSKYDYYCEVAHLEISNNCNMNCKYCYVGGKEGKELDTESWKKILNNLANAGIFQVSFGGGEPTMRRDLFELAAYVNELGMNLGMTTNGINLPKLDPYELRKYFKQINVSWHQDLSVMDKAMDHLMDNNIPRGINYAYSKDMAKDNIIVKTRAKDHDAELLYLVYKPVIGDWENQVSGPECLKAAKEAANEGLKVAVDGPCVNQCLMKRKFIDVDSLGYVYPCSFVRKPLGNLLNTQFRDIWKERGEQDKCPFVELIKEENKSGQ
jgi:MoaA/NifB/PqqE/SkfB family radical SAM enzyme